MKSYLDENDLITVEVIDNGCGFNPSKVDGGSHSGLANGTARLKIALGASTIVKSSIGHGTDIKITFPRKDERK